MTSASLHSLVLGLIQGLTEFLPISSSAHLILIPRYLGWEDPGLAFDVALHLGTLAGVVIYFWKDLLDLATNITLPPQKKIVTALILATIPGALAGFLLEHRVETIFRSPGLIAGALILMGTLLALADWLSKGDKSLPDLSITMALVIGLSQCFALIPGVSRSGVTITTALALGLNRRDAAKFSFLLSVPIIAGAGVLKCKAIFHSPDKLALGIGFLAASLAGLFAIWALLKIIQTKRFTPFVIYRWALGLLVLLNLNRF